MDISIYKEIEEMKRPTKKCRVDDTISNNNNKKLEDLPKHLIHKIMHLLPYQEAAMFSVLSKSFNSYWLSFPILNFNYKSTSSSSSSSSSEDVSYDEDTFFNFVQKTLQLHGPYIKDSLQKLSLSYIEMHKFNFYPFPKVFDVLLNFAIQNSVKEIKFDIKEPVHIISNMNYDSLRPLFSSQSLTVLKLTGLRVPWVDNIFITCPNLTELVFHSCDGIRTLNFSSSSSSLKQVEVKCCRGLKTFHILEGKSLQSFKFEGLRINYELLRQYCNIKLPTCDSLRYLHLTNVEVSEDIFSNKVVPQVESLCLDRCDMPNKNLRFYNSHIKVLEMKSNYKLENLVLSTPNLECFMYETPSESETIQCTLDISDCLALRVLKLINATNITDGWLNRTVRGLCYLEELEIYNCDLLEKMEFENDSLKKLSLSECLGLKEVHANVPNLLEFYCSGKIWFPMLILSAKCNLNISLPFGISDIFLMNRFLSNFKHFKALSLSCLRFKYMIFSKQQLLGDNLSPLYDLRHLKLEAIGEPLPSGRTLTRLLKSLFRLVTKPQTITLYSKSTKTMSTLKFKYGKKVETTNSSKMEECCYNVCIKCWRHYEVEIEFQGFDEPEREYLNKFFARRLRYYGIYRDSAKLNI